jgi:hypothetical protein
VMRARHIRGAVPTWSVDGDVVVATGTSSYRDRPDGPIVRV